MGRGKKLGTGNLIFTISSVDRERSGEAENSGVDLNNQFVGRFLILSEKENELTLEVSV